jgi:hypothetical protein
MADWETTPEEYLLYIQEWIEEYGIDFDKYVSHDEMTQEQYDMLVELDKQGLVWTEHGTCEDNMYSFGFSVFGDCSLLKQESSGCGCYQSYGYYIGTVEGSEEYITSTAYLPCSVCNPDGEGEGVEDCEGPEVPEGAGSSGCDGGFINWYFD